ncbi:O-antigen ligase family protein [Butyrivibrio sp. MC2013]|uniref:O-antigen ligase family protein n=1 Tax=Butyrivibrio sp. MC2013 TaxID=1280686 RepID=UPI00040C18C4|nr:hypothetical protein [Butyrivibrio sp. MC2013]
MSNKLAGKNKTKSRTGKLSADCKKMTGRDITSLAIKALTLVYLIILTVCHPLYYHNGYYDIGEAKWKFYKALTFYYYDTKNKTFIPGYIIILAILFILSFLYRIMKKESLSEIIAKSRFSMTDIIVLCYGLICILSALFAPYSGLPEKSGDLLLPKLYNVIGGYSGWYMGLAAQLSFVIIYFAVSRSYTEYKALYYVFGASYFTVIFIAFINGFSIDPLDILVKGKNFLTTMGNPNWFSSYLTVCLPVFIFLFWDSRKIYVRILSMIVMIFAFMDQAMGWSESAIPGILSCLFAFFCFSFIDKRHIYSFIELLIVVTGSFRLAGLLYKLLPDMVTAYGDDDISSGLLNKAMHSAPVLILLILLIVLYISMRITDRKGFLPDPSSYILLRNIIAGIVAFSLILAPVYVFLNTKGFLPDALSSRHNYLYFDRYWGSWRGGTWIAAGETIGRNFKEDILSFFIGSGPDGFYKRIYEYFPDFEVPGWGKTTIACAHNEWLNMYVNLGILGGSAYLMIFVTSVSRMISLYKKDIRAVLVAAAIISYMAHNFFTYQTVCCSPIVFVIMGYGAWLARAKKGDGY